MDLRLCDERPRRLARPAKAIGATGRERIIVTHGSTDVMVRWLCEQGLDAQVFATEYGDDNGDDPDARRPRSRPAPPAAEAAP